MVPNNEPCKNCRRFDKRTEPCEKCKSVYYFNRRCRRTDEKKHRRDCESLRKEFKTRNEFIWYHTIKDTSIGRLRARGPCLSKIEALSSIQGLLAKFSPGPDGLERFNEMTGRGQHDDEFNADNFLFDSRTSYLDDEGKVFQDRIYFRLIRKTNASIKWSEMDLSFTIIRNEFIRENGTLAAKDVVIEETYNDLSSANLALQTVAYNKFLDPVILLRKGTTSDTGLDLTWVIAANA